MLLLKSVCWVDWHRPAHLISRTCRRRRAAQGNGRARGTLLTSLRLEPQWCFGAMWRLQFLDVFGVEVWDRWITKDYLRFLCNTLQLYLNYVGLIYRMRCHILTAFVRSSQDWTSECSWWPVQLAHLPRSVSRREAQDGQKVWMTKNPWCWNPEAWQCTPESYTGNKKNILGLCCTPFAASLAFNFQLMATDRKNMGNQWKPMNYLSSFQTVVDHVESAHSNKICETVPTVLFASFK